ncbi:MAG: DUF998 domain-containing protein [Nitrolancea sp.]
MVSILDSVRLSIESHPGARIALLGAGFVSSVLYVVVDLAGSLRYPGYSYTDQAFSELTAQGSPVRTLMIAANAIPYTVLVSAFAAGVWILARPAHTARVTGALLGGYALVGLVGAAAFPMPTRGTDGTLRNTMHIPATAVMSLCIMLAMVFGARLLGKRFRWYSYATLAALILFGLLTSLHGSRVANNESTPWMGIEERVNIYGTMLWFAVLSIGLLKVEAVDLTHQIAPRVTTFGRTNGGRPKLPA